MAPPVSPVDLPALLNEHLASFTSGESVLDNWLRQRARGNLRTAASCSYEICPAGSMHATGYYALSMGQILAQEATGAMRWNMPRQLPSEILGRLAIDQGYQGGGSAARCICDATRRSLLAAKEVPARLMIVHAISPAAEAPYLHHGFTRLPVETPTFAIDLAKLAKVT